MAMAATGLASVVSFVLDGDGRVLDGTPLHTAIELIDAEAPPLFYSISCVHPSIAARALRNGQMFSNLVARRLVEFKANASALSTEKLVRLTTQMAITPSTSPPERGRFTRSSACESSAVAAAPTTVTYAPSPPEWQM